MKIIEQQPSVLERFCATRQQCPWCRSSFQATPDDCTVFRDIVKVVCPVCNEPLSFQSYDVYWPELWGGQRFMYQSFRVIGSYHEKH